MDFTSGVDGEKTMNIEELKNSGLIFYETIVGSRAYGTNDDNSDFDIKGFYWVDPKEYISLNPPVLPQDCQINDEGNNTTYYSLYRAFELLQTANPNISELLWMPQDCIQKIDSVIMPELIANRKIFISKQAYYSHAEYARNQIKKCRGKNKKVHNPQPETMPVKEDFCRVILLENLQGYMDFTQALHPRTEENGWTYKGLYPFRPVPLKESGMDLSRYHVASLEHTPNVYRLYYYGEKSKGVFRGDDMLVCASIPKEDEWRHIVGLLIYDHNEWVKAVKDWHSYWDFMKNRNESRWTSQIEGKIDYDVKNMQHCFRLIYEGLNILTTGEPVVRFEGKRLQFLREIREEKYTYDELMERLAVLEVRLKDAFEYCDLPEQADPKVLNELYKHLMKLGYDYD